MQCLNSGVLCALNLERPKEVYKNVIIKLFNVLNISHTVPGTNRTGEGSALKDSKGAGSWSELPTMVLIC